MVMGSSWKSGAQHQPSAIRLECGVHGSLTFDEVYCVFDRDAHANYNQALARISSLSPKGVFHAVVSIPSFEVWFLLHFRYSTKSYVSNGKGSAGDHVLSELLTYWPDYKKGSQNTFSALFQQLEQAKIFADKLNAFSTASASFNPMTDVHELVSTLQDIKKSSGV